MTDWEPCPRCGSKRVKPWGYWRSVGIFAVLGLGGSLFLILGMAFWPLLIVGGTLVALSFAAFIPLFAKVKICRDCKFQWNPKKMKNQNKAS
jgi:hypothetical protein